MKLIFLYGPPAVGKLTVAREIERLSGVPVFHNHLVVDLLTSVFPFGSPEFRELRERIWLSVFDRAAAAGRDLIFTFAPERTVSPGFPAAARQAVTIWGGAACFVSLTCPEAVVRERLEAAERREWGKLASWKTYQDLRDEGAFEYAMEVDADLVLDTGSLSPEESASGVVEACLND